jgi:hypothetical protein
MVLLKKKPQIENKKIAHLVNEVGKNTTLSY